MAKTTDKSRSVEIEVSDLQQEEVTFCILGETPFYCNRVTEKAKRELLFPRGRLTTAQKSNHLKHDPLEEYRNSPYCRKGDGPTRIMMMATAFKGAIGQAAIDMPTAVARAQIDRLVYVVDEFVPIFGVPMLDMAVVRSADMARTPDIRTRARINKWASVVTIRYTLPMVTEKVVSKLLVAAGIMCGIGDFRQQKGKGNNGLYRVVNRDDPEFLALIANGGTAAQDKALDDPEFSNSETEDLFLWFQKERETRRQEPKPTRGRKPKEIEDAWIAGGVANGEDHSEAVN
jgi:hypothetical protein